MLAAALPVFDNPVDAESGAGGSGRADTWYLADGAATYLQTMGQVGESITLFEESVVHALPAFTGQKYSAGEYDWS